MFGLGTTEIILILVVILVVFGASKLPTIGKGMGEAIRNFKKSVNDVEDATDITPVITKKEEAPKAKAPESEKTKENV